METYFELSNTDPPIMTLVKEPATENVFIYTASARATKTYKIRRANIGGQSVEAVNLVLNVTSIRPANYSTDMIPFSGAQLRAVTVGDRVDPVQVVGDFYIHCWLPIQFFDSALGSISLAMSGSDMFIGRDSSITRVVNASSRLNCRARAEDSRCVVITLFNNHVFFSFWFFLSFHIA